MRSLTLIINLKILIRHKYIINSLKRINTVPMSLDGLNIFARGPLAVRSIMNYCFTQLIEFIQFNLLVF